MEKNYFIKKSYKSREQLATFENGKRKYWTNQRIRNQSRIHYQYQAHKFCRKLIKEKKIKSVLDIGCGPAFLLMKLIYPLCKNTYGIDNEEFIIKFCGKNYNSNNFYVDDIENPTLNLNKKFDLIVCFDVIEHLLNPDKLLEYFQKYCHKNTFIVISTPERDISRGYNCNFSPEPSHIREWNTKEFIKYLKNRKFKLISHKIVSYRRFLFKLPKKLSDLKQILYDIYNMRKFRSNQLVVCKLKN